MFGLGPYLKKYFELSKSEFRAFIVLSWLILVVFLAIWFWPNPKNREIEYVLLQNLTLKNNPIPNSANFFQFNPNQISRDSLALLGMPEKAIQSIVRFRQAGGQIRDSSTWFALYNLPEIWAKALLPFVEFPVKNNYSNYNYSNKNKKNSKIYPKLFNPNLVDAKTLISFGLDSKLAIRWENFTSKGGRFKAPNDLYKLYNIDSNIVQQLLPFLIIVDDTIKNQKDYARNESIILEINSADSLQLLQIKGIGPTFASRILKYRQRLGGFIKKEQLLEVYGIDIDKFETIKHQIQIDPQQIMPIDINNSTQENLGKHPYIGYKAARIIFNFRQQHGIYLSKDDLLRSKALTETELEKLLPYLKF